MHDTFTAIRVHDPAFAEAIARRAITDDDVVRYARTRTAEDMPAIPADLSPAVFTCRRLTRSQVHHVMRATTEEERHERAFAAGVVRVSGGEFGAEGWEPADARRADFSGMEPGELERFALADEWEIGSVILLRSYAPKASALRYRVLLTSLHVLEGDVVFRSAERSRSDAPPTSAARRQE